MVKPWVAIDELSSRVKIITSLVILFLPLSHLESVRLVMLRWLMCPNIYFSLKSLNDIRCSHWSHRFSFVSCGRSIHLFKPSIFQCSYRFSQHIPKTAFHSFLFVFSPEPFSRCCRWCLSPTFSCFMVSSSDFQKQQSPPIVELNFVPFAFISLLFYPCYNRCLL